MKTKKIHIKLSEKSWNELEDTKRQIGYGKPKSYKQYLKEEKEKPTYAYLY